MLGRARVNFRGSMDVAAGVTVAKVIAQMHLLTAGRQFPGRRNERADPMVRLSRWLTDDGNDSDFLTIAGAEEFVDAVRSNYVRWAELLSRQPDLPVGLTHGDVKATNVLFNPDGSVAALLDFDDCLSSYVLYDLCSLIWAWGREDSGVHDGDRISSLVAAYQTVRPLTADELALLPDLYGAFLAADGASTVSWWWRGERNPRPVADSHSARGFLDLISQPDWGGCNGTYLG